MKRFINFIIKKLFASDSGDYQFEFDEVGVLAELSGVLKRDYYKKK